MQVPDDMMERNHAHLILKDGDRMLSMATFDDSIIKELSLPWQDVLMIKLLGKHVSYLAMKDCLKQQWRPQADFDMMSMDKGYSMVKFDSTVDREKMIGGGPWLLFNHYLVVKE